ncbi:MAG: 16S rRNA (guanine(527)-N(7))-methyltransferase RsmG [Gammaproteobacteria bacterium]
MRAPDADSGAVLRDGLAALQLELTDRQIDQLAAFVRLLRKWNDVYNLTGEREPARIVRKHLLDSLSICEHVSGPLVSDIGSGAGLPGIPLAIARPKLRFMLIDANGKKSRFMRQAVIELELPNVEVCRQRAESHTPGERAATVVSRAFGPLRRLGEVAGHLLTTNGRILAMKGRYPDDELQDLPSGFRVEAVHRIEVPGLRDVRHLIELTRS